MSAFRYKAFISYSWADATWGNWLHRVLETYRTPAALVGKNGAHGVVPARLIPLFKDREEQAAGASISASLDAALADSEFLVVICSPRSAASQWVNHEIAWFKTNRDPSKILALIIDGEPSECFPPALTHRIAPDLTVTDVFEEAPLAADARNSGDGSRRAKLKLAAAMLGVGLDELVGRDERRRTLRIRAVVGGSLALALVMSALALMAVRARDEADRQRAESDGLVEFMLTDLRERLEPVGRLDVLDVVGQRALKYYAGQKAGGLDADSLGRRSRALHLVGEVSNIRGDSAAGLTAFRQAAATTAELLARDPENQQRIFDHAQSVFWVGYIAYERGETKEAEAQFREYKRLADRLIELNPKKLEWQMEASYAESNLGILLYDQGRFSEAAPPLVRALAMAESVAASERHPIARQLEVGVAINWLGKANEAINRPADALALHRREVAVYQRVLKTDPANTQGKWLLAVAWQHIGALEQILGQISPASEAFVTSTHIMEELRALETDNTEWRETELRGQLRLAENFLYAGRYKQGQLVLESAREGVAGLIAADAKNMVWTVDLQSTADQRQAQFALAGGRPEDALRLADGVIARMKAVPKFEPSQRIGFLSYNGIFAGDALAALGRRREAAARWEMALDEIERSSTANLLKVRRARYLLLKRLKRFQEATAAAAELDRQGDRSPAYLRER